MNKNKNGCDIQKWLETRAEMIPIISKNWKTLVSSLLKFKTIFKVNP